MELAGRQRGSSRAMIVYEVCGCRRTPRSSLADR
jgi:hypothetical protein